MRRLPPPNWPRRPQRNPLSPHPRRNPYPRGRPRPGWNVPWWAIKRQPPRSWSPSSASPPMTGRRDWIPPRSRLSNIPTFNDRTAHSLRP
ncbi:MAG TPA: hypothetical protein DEH22_10345 [Chloroflexi bacterium]|nr:hypothetical protein [Chloroflexota bacterium]